MSEICSHFFTLLPEECLWLWVFLLHNNNNLHQIVPSFFFNIISTELSRKKSSFQFEWEKECEERENMIFSSSFVCANIVRINRIADGVLTLYVNGIFVFLLSLSSRLEFMRASLGRLMSRTRERRKQHFYFIVLLHSFNPCWGGTQKVKLYS